MASWKREPRYRHGGEARLLAQFAGNGLFGALALFDIAREQLKVAVADMFGEKDAIFRTVDDRHRNGDGKEGELEFAAMGTVRHKTFVFQKTQRKFLAAISAIHKTPHLILLLYVENVQMSTIFEKIMQKIIVFRAKWHLFVGISGKNGECFYGGAVFCGQRILGKGCLTLDNAGAYIV